MHKVETERTIPAGHVRLESRRPETNKYASGIYPTGGPARRTTTVGGGLRLDRLKNSRQMFFYFMIITT